MFYCLLKYNFVIFAIILLFVELHVIYIVACLIFTTVQYDAYSNVAVATSEFLLKSRIYFLILAFAIFFFINACFFKKYQFSNEKTLIILLINNSQLNFYNKGVFGFLNYSILLNQAFLIILSFEFFLINILLFFVFVCYTTILFFCKNVESVSIYETLRNYKSLVSSNDLFLRLQKQLTQLLRSAVSRTVTNTKVFFSKKSTKGL